MVTIEIDGKTKSVKLPSSSTLADLLKKLGYTTDTMVITVNNRVTLPSEKIPKGKIKLYRVVSGG